MIYTSPFPDVEIPATALTEEVFRHVRRLGDRVAVIDGPTGRTYTYSQLLEAARRTAGGMVANGLERGDVVAILAPNLPEYAIVFHGVALAGAAVTTINPTYTVDEVAFQLRDSGARLLVTIPFFRDLALEAAAETSVEVVYSIGGGDDSCRSFSELLKADPIEQVGVDPAVDVVALPYSSGTTGLPKGVQLTHRNLVANLVQYDAVSTADESDVVLAILPFFHIYGMQLLMNGVLHCGARVVTMPRFDLEEFLRTIEEHQVTRVAVVPPIVVALAKSPLVDRYDLTTLVQIGSGAAPLSAEVEAEAARRTGAPVVQGFGLTETSPVTHAMSPDEPRQGSIGVPVPNTEVRVVSPDGEDLGHGVAGEIWIRGPQVMKGYLNDDSATRATIDDAGWLHTGDVGHVDDDGFWYVTDRLKELIKFKGFQVAPAELEAILLTHPAIADAAVIGVADENAGEVPKAFVVLVDGSLATQSEIVEFVASRVASYKQIRTIEFIDVIPKSLSGKILRRVLRDRESAIG
jgi:acyl-CoA synthetase (AMP-forming)/AMP-acid ligase II